MLWAVGKSMNEETPSPNKIIKEKSSIQTEQEYIDECVRYALSGGWVKEAKKDILVDDYLKPIYRKYLGIIEDLRKEKVPERELGMIILKMNYCLEATRRIGSTDPNNIIRSIEDFRNQARDEYTEYALTSLLDYVSGVIRS